MVEWIKALRLEAPAGTLTFMSLTGTGEGDGMWQLDQSRCKATRGLRVNRDPVPQNDGSVNHRRFADGVEFELALQLWADEETYACDAQARLMAEHVALVLGSMLNEPGRFFWQPTGYPDERMMDQARWLGSIEESMTPSGLVTLTFSIDTPLPYVIDKTQDTVEVSGSSTLTNEGNVPFYPVMQVTAAGDFTIENTSVLDDDGNSLKIVYDTSRPGAAAISGFGEIDAFKNSIYLNGDEDDLAAGIDPELTDYFVLAPGENDIVVTGGSVDFLLNNAWHP